jgi:hypothetical protein
MPNVWLRRSAAFQVRSALLGHRNYRLIDIRMILDQLICIRPNLVCRSFLLSQSAKGYFRQVRSMDLEKNRCGALLDRDLLRCAGMNGGWPGNCLLCT